MGFSVPANHHSNIFSNINKKEFLTRNNMSLSQNTKLKNNCRIFLETGTFHGDGINRAIDSGFKKIISIEIFEELYKENIERFKFEIEKGLVEIVLGDSGYVIGEAIKKIEEPILFWFDAHDQTMNNAGVGDVKCPIIKELKNIMDVRSKSERRLDILIIDDMRLITNKEIGWDVNLSEMYESIWNYNPDFRLTREEGYVEYDILRCENKFFSNY